jgi:capsular exopolysaccharide synthesis family protein
MDNQSEERSTAELFSQYASLLLRWSWLLILMALLAGGVAYLVASRQTPIYQASTLVMINGAPSSQLDTYSSLTTSQQLAGTYAKVMTTKPVLDGVAERLGLPEITPESIQVQPIQNTQLLEVTVQDTDPDRAAAIANMLVTVFSEQINADQATRYADSKKNLETQLALLDQQTLTATNALNALGNVDPNSPDRIQLETSLSQYRQSYASLLQSYEQIRLAEAQSTSRIIQKDPAIPQRVPIQPQPVRSGLLAAVVGLMLAAGIIFLIEFLDDTIRDPQEITRNWGIPVLGMITSYDPGKSKNSLITVNQPRSPVSEAFRSLRTNLQFASVATPLHTLLITSSSPEDGKTTIAANLGTVFAQSGRSVVVVDADLRRPRIHKMFKLSNRIGLTDQFIRPQDHLNGAVKPTDIKDLSVVTSGSLPPNPSELLGSDRMLEVLRQLSGQYNTIILDTPPVLVVTDALVLAPRVDGVVLVVKPSVTKRAALRHAIEQLQQVNANYHYSEKTTEAMIAPEVENTGEGAEGETMFRNPKKAPEKKRK